MFTREDIKYAITEAITIFSDESNKTVNAVPITFEWEDGSIIEISGLKIIEKERTNNPTLIAVSAYFFPYLSQSKSDAKYIPTNVAFPIVVVKPNIVTNFPDIKLVYNKFAGTVAIRYSLPIYAATYTIHKSLNKIDKKRNSLV